MASNFYRAADKPRYILGHGLELGFIAVGITAAVIMVISYSLINKKRTRMVQQSGDAQDNEELSARGDKAYTFRYMY